MGLTELWKTSREQLKDKHIQQIIAFAGDGHLKDHSSASPEFREFLATIPSEILKKYADECLQNSFRDSGFALQDIVNQIGRRLGFEAVDGRYRGTSKHIGFDGLWHFPTGHAIIVEVKTTDAYRIDLNKLAAYRRALIDSKKITETQSSILRYCWALLRQVAGASAANDERRVCALGGPSINQATTRVRFMAAAVAKCCKCVLAKPI
jgi:hypothetical protein